MNKNQIIQKLNTRVAYHIYFWTCIFCFMVINHLEMEETLSHMLLRTFIFMCLMVIPVYMHLFVFDRLFIKKRYIFYTLCLIFIIAFYVLIKNAVVITFYDGGKSIFRNIYLIFTYIILTTSLKIGKAGFKQKLTLQKIKAQHLQTELALLKSQINPHFLFNTLNNLYGLVLKLDKSVAGGIAQLSHLMRYMIYETNVERIPLDKEIEQIRRLIDLYKLRFHKDDDISIDFEIIGKTESVEIPPMLLIPFVENAFKHGISLKEPSHIAIELSVGQSAVRFLIRNSNHPSNENDHAQESGMGLQNVKRRLELLFPGTHVLDLSESDDEFIVDLTFRFTGES